VHLWELSIFVELGVKNVAFFYNMGRNNLHLCLFNFVSLFGGLLFLVVFLIWFDCHHISCRQMLFWCKCGL
jgi:hypothetical protein